MKHMFISTEWYERLVSEKKASEEQVKELNRENKALYDENKALYDENKHLRSMVRLYEATLSNGIEVNFPNTDPDDERTSDAGIDFDDF